MYVKILNSNAKYTRAKSETEICTIHQVHIDSFFVISAFLVFASDYAACGLFSPLLMCVRVNVFEIVRHQKCQGCWKS